MIRINLLPLKDAERAVGRRQQLSLLALGVCFALMIMLLPYLYQGRRLSTLDRQTTEVRAQIERYNAQVKEVHQLDSLKKDLEAKLQIIEDLDHKRVGPARVLDDLSHASPDELWLLSFEEAGAAATLTGMALDNETIARFMRLLGSSAYFYAVDLVETSRAVQPVRSGGANESIPFTRFIVKARIDYFGRGGRPERGDGNGTGAPIGAKQPMGKTK